MLDIDNTTITSAISYVNSIDYIPDNDFIKIDMGTLNLNNYLGVDLTGLITIHEISGISIKDSSNINLDLSSSSISFIEESGVNYIKITVPEKLYKSFNYKLYYNGDYILENKTDGYDISNLIVIINYTASVDTQGTTLTISYNTFASKDSIRIQFFQMFFNLFDARLR